MVPDVLITLGVAVSAVALDDALAISERSYRKQRLNERTNHSEQGVYQLYFADSGVPESIALQSWREVAGILRVAPGKMRPADTVVGVMGYHRRLRGARSDVDALLRFVRLRLEDGNYVPPRRFRTVDEVVQCLIAVRMQHCLVGAGKSPHALRSPNPAR